MNTLLSFALKLLPAPVVGFLADVAEAARGLLQGETLRAIGYGAGVVIYLVAKAVGSIPDVSFDQAVLQAGAAAAVLVSVVETVRHYVYSPATVAGILVEQAPNAKEWVELPTETSVSTTSGGTFGDAGLG